MVLINVGFVLLNIFHLAYAGVMFDVTSEEAGLQQQVNFVQRRIPHALVLHCIQYKSMS